MEVKVIYTFEINDTTITLTGEQARELYNELQKTFGQTIPQQPLIRPRVTPTVGDIPSTYTSPVWYSTNSMDCGGDSNTILSYKTSVYWNSDKTNNQNTVDEIGC